MFRTKSAKVERIKSAKKKKTKKVSIVGEDKIEKQNTNIFPESGNVTTKTKFEDAVKENCPITKNAADVGIVEKTTNKNSGTNSEGRNIERNNETSKEHECVENFNIDALILNYKSTEGKQEVDIMLVGQFLIFKPSYINSVTLPFSSWCHANSKTFFDFELALLFLV